MKKNVLGLYLSEKAAQAVLIERNSSRHTLLALHEWDNTLFDYAGDDTPGMDEFVDHLSQFVATTQCTIQQARVALDTSLLFVNKFPVEMESTAEKVQEQVDWELSEYFPGMPRNAFISGTYSLPQHAGTPYGSVLAISARRELVQKMHRALGKLQLKLEIVDPDHFSANTALRMNYPETATRFCALLAVKDERLDVSLLRHDEVESFTYYNTTSRDQHIERITALSQSAAGLHSIIVFGTHLDKDLLTQMRNASPTLVEALNPFRIVDVAEAVRLTNDPTQTPFRYAAAIGVALRDQ